MASDAPPPLMTRDGRPAAELWLLDPAVVHLNHGSFGAAPRSTVEHRAALLSEVEANPLRWHLGQGHRRDQARSIVAAFLGVPEERLAFVPTASAGTTAVLRGYSGGEVVITDHAYGALSKHVSLESVRAGGRIVRVHVPLDADADRAADAILEAVSARTRIVVLDQVTSGTARRMPVDRVAAALRDLGIPLLVDAAHAPGMLASPAVPEAHAWIGNLHKWACGVRGSAVAALDPDTALNVRPPTESWASDGSYPETFDEQGAADETGYFASAAGLTVLEEEIGWDRIREYQRGLVEYGRDLISDAFGRETGEDHSVAVGMPAPSMALVALPVGLAKRPEVGGVLRQRIADELGFETQIAVWNGVARLRLSAHAYSTAADFERFAERAVPKLVRWARDHSSV